MNTGAQLMAVFGFQARMVVGYVVLGLFAAVMVTVVVVLVRGLLRERKFKGMSLPSLEIGGEKVQAADAERKDEEASVFATDSEALGSGVSDSILKEVRRASGGGGKGLFSRG